MTNTKTQSKRTKTQYRQELEERAKQTSITPLLLKNHNIRSMMCNSRHGFEYKCLCCHDTDDNWMDDWNLKLHVNNDKHERNHTMFRSLETLKKENEEAKKRIKELEKELFEFKGVNRIKSFMNECEEADYISVCEDDEVQLPNGKTITRPITYSVAPTSFDEIFYDFSKWSEDKFTGDVCKDSVKKFLLEYQKNSVFGLEIGEYDEELKKNGTYDKPRFNFTYIETSL